MTGMPPDVLLPLPEESVNGESSRNQIIEGENLQVLSVLSESLDGQVKLVYIDPPYNTGKAFTYKDDIGHGWVEMMRPRLQAAHALLREDGAIVIHIDEHEMPRLSLLLDEIFGPENRLGTIIWDKLNPKGDATGIATQHESILCCAKHRPTFIERHPLVRTKENAGRMLDVASRLVADHGSDTEGSNAAFRKWIRSQPHLSGGEAAYSRIDEDGRVFQAVSMAWPNKRIPPQDYFQPLQHPLTGKDCPVPARGWRNPPETMKRLLDEGRVVFGPTERTQPRRKYFLHENQTECIPSVLRDGGHDDALLASLGTPFDHAKPLSVARKLIRWFTREPKDIVVDFFAGSGTTAHATLLENQERDSSLQFILVQSAEPVIARSLAAQAGFETVVQVTRARVRAAVAALNRDHPATGPQDRGFQASRFIGRK